MKRRVLRLMVAACLILGLCAAPPLHAEDGSHDVGVAWFGQVRDALKAAKAAGRPLWVSVHAVPRTDGRRWPHDLTTWTRMYRDPRIVKRSKDFACAQIVKKDMPKALLEDSPMQMILDGDGRILFELRGWQSEPGNESIEALEKFLIDGLVAFGTIATDAPRITASDVAKATPPSRDRGKPILLQGTSKGLRLRLRFELPTPAADPSDAKNAWAARANMYWDGHGPFFLDDLQLKPGGMIDQAIDVRFADFPALQNYLTKGDHELVLELAPLRDGIAFAKGPIPVGHATIRFGDNGGGGGNQPPKDPPPPENPEQPPPNEDPPEDPPDPPPPMQPPPPPPAEQRVEVVEPVLPEDGKVKKKDAVVAVEDPDAGVEPPKRIPLEAAAAALKRAKDAAIRNPLLLPADRRFLRRYFEALEKAAGGGK